MAHSILRPLRGARSLRYPQELLDLGTVEVVLQPIVNVTTGDIVAAEALARFPNRRSAPVDTVFSLAHAAGWGAELEAACLQTALGKRAEMPANAVLTVNVSPNALAHPAVQLALRGDLSGIAVEVTENAATDSASLHASLADIRRRGGKIAIDDASTGYAGLLRLSSLRPDIVKLDRGLVTGARGNDVQTVVIEALVSLARRIGARTLGEGVESLDDLRLLGELDVDYAQGWATGRPAAQLAQAQAEVMRACRAARRDLMDASSSSYYGIRQGTGAITAALAGSAGPEDLQAALAAASTDLGVDVVGLSMLSGDGYLHEITAAGAQVDPYTYAVVDYPATLAALQTATMVEAHVNDPETDSAERAILIRDGLASLLVTPVIDGSQALGILEFSNFTHHQWTRRDIVQARTVAEHLASALRRMSENGERDASA
jgi:EAL domain-containing protein (putative c-di-GMP-specific phosphodiesterase class I)